MREQQLWEKCKQFHGHACGGLAIGFKAALYAAELLDLDFSADEESVCISENDACGTDAIQVVLGCSVGKGNLLFHMTGKDAFSFYNRKTGKSTRLILKKDLDSIPHEETLQRFCEMQPVEMFDITDTKLSLPEKAEIFDSCVCECCGEVTGTNWIRIQNGKRVCLDCFYQYDRFHV